MKLVNETIPRRHVNTYLAIGGIISSLYLPQLWILFIDYPWNGYHLSWLELLPGLPAFAPVMLVLAMGGHNTTFLICPLLALIGIMVAILFVLRQKHPIAFWTALIGTCGLSIFSAYAAYGAFMY